MTSPDASSSFAKSPEAAIPTLNLFTMLRLGVFNMGLGIMSLLTLGVLNRIMIDELQVPALIAAGTIAVHQFMAPARVWFGQMSDSRPLLGYHRSGYIWCGILAVALTSFCAVQVVWRIGAAMEAHGWGSQVYPWVGLLALLFAVYGLALSATSTPFTALLVDVSDEQSSLAPGGDWLGHADGGYCLRGDHYFHRVEASIARCFLRAGAKFCQSTVHHRPGGGVCAGLFEHRWH
jgi:BCD family chlorophyll transporter-like MFS transporter